MKVLLIIPIAALLFSCGTQKEVIATNSVETVVDETVDSNEEIANQSTNYRVIGTVHLTEGGCGVYIVTQTSPEKFEKLYPVNLEDQFKVESARIKFDFNLSRAMIPEGCDVDYAVTVTDVTRMRN